jgi:hypothetical protein
MGRIKINLKSLKDLEDEFLDDEYFYEKKTKIKKKKPNNDEERTVSED